MQAARRSPGAAVVNFSRIAPSTLVGRALRTPLRLLPAGAVLPVLQGPARGMRWVVGSATHGCWLGSYEAEKVALAARLVPPGGVVFDIGANVGYYALVFSRLVGPRGVVVAFEPLPRNAAALRRHLALNGLENVTLVEAAVADRDGKAGFEEARSPAMGRLVPGGSIEVEVLRLDAWRERAHQPAPTVLKIDTEGSELSVLQGAAATIAESRPVIFCATHGSRVHADCVDWLADRGYRLETIGAAADELVAFPPAAGPALALRRDHAPPEGSHDLVAGTHAERLGGCHAS